MSLLHSSVTRHGSDSSPPRVSLKLLAVKELGSGLKVSSCKVWISSEKDNVIQVKTIRSTIKEANWDGSALGPFPVTDPLSDTLHFEIILESRAESSRSGSHSKVPNLNLGGGGSKGKEDSESSMDRSVDATPPIFSTSLFGLTNGVDKLQWLTANQGQGQLQIALTSMSFDTASLTPKKTPGQIEKGIIMDMADVPVYLPPPRFTEKDPRKFHPRTKSRFSGGWFLLFFNKPYYIGGETVYGRVDVNLKAPLVAEEFRVQFKGFERVVLESTVTSRDGDNFGDKTQSNKENKILFKHTLTVAKSASGSFDAGLWSWVFSFKLPADLPASTFIKIADFDGAKIKAAVMYKCKVFAQTSNGKSKVKTTETLVVTELRSQGIEPVALNVNKGFTLTKGKMDFSISVGKDVFKGGEVIPVVAKVENSTSKKVKTFKVTLQVTVTPKFKGYSKVYTSRLLEMRFPGVDKKTNAEKVLAVMVPQDLIPSSNAHLFTVSYGMYVELGVPMAIDIELRPPVFIAYLPPPSPNAASSLYQGLTGWKAF